MLCGAVQCSAAVLLRVLLFVVVATKPICGEADADGVRL